MSVHLQNLSRWVAQRTRANKDGVSEESLLFGLAQLILADHDGRFGRRDIAGWPLANPAEYDPTTSTSSSPNDRPAGTLERHPGGSREHRQEVLR